MFCAIHQEIVINDVLQLCFRYCLAAGTMSRLTNVKGLRECKNFVDHKKCQFRYGCAVEFLSQLNDLIAEYIVVFISYGDSVLDCA